MAVSKNDVEGEKKITLIICLAVAGILILLNFILKFKLRSPLWFVLIGLHIVMGDIMTLIVILAVSSSLDEFVFSPLIERTKIELHSNIQIDKRQP
jgi:hypothetical protein